MVRDVLSNNISKYYFHGEIRVTYQKHGTNKTTPSGNPNSLHNITDATSGVTFAQLLLTNLSRYFHRTIQAKLKIKQLPRTCN